MKALARCRICQSSRIEFRVELETWLADGIPRRFFSCRDCHSLMDEAGSPVPYGESTSECSQPSFIQYQLQAGCCFHLNAVSVLLAQSAWDKKQASRPQFLDVGSGLGFSLWFAQRLGFEAIGIEPSAAGEVAHSLLGVKSEAQYLEKMALPLKAFDIIHSSEVLEHAADPAEFVKSLTPALKEDGVLLLTTPNAEAALQGHPAEREWLECYVPGHHMNILSVKSMTGILRACGFHGLQILTLDGTSGRKRLLIAATLRKDGLGRLPSLSRLKKEGRILTDEFLEHIVRDKQSGQYGQWLYAGALFRQFEEFVHQGAYQRAQDLSRHLDEYLLEAAAFQQAWDKVECCGFEDYIRQVPAFAGMYSYLKGMLALNGTKDYPAAFEQFARAEHLLRLESRLLYYKPSRGEWPEKARFHRGLALLYAGRRHEAIALFDGLLQNDGQDLSADLKNRIYANKGVAHLQKRDNRQALRAFTKQLLGRPMPLSQGGRTLKHLWKSVQQTVHDRG